MRRREIFISSKAGRYERDSRIQSPDESVWADELLNHLPEGYRKVMELRFFQGLSFVEIAEELDDTYEAVRSRYHRGIRFLRGELS